MSYLYYCTKCGKPIIMYSNENVDDITCTSCCRKYHKKIVPDKYIIYKSVAPELNEELENDFIENILKNESNFDLTLCWFYRRGEINAIHEHNESLLNSYTQSQSNVPKCPTCGSTNITKIGTFNRMMSTGLFGLASGKIGKTMRCRNCGMTW